MLIRFLFVLGGLLLIYALLKGMKKKGDEGSRTFRGASFSRARKEKDMGELVKDPVSGTYIAKGKATTRVIAGETYYFESEENAIEFLESRQK